VSFSNFLQRCLSWLISRPEEASVADSEGKSVSAPVHGAERSDEQIEQTAVEPIASGFTRSGRTAIEQAAATQAAATQATTAPTTDSPSAQSEDATKKNTNQFAQEESVEEVFEEQLISETLSVRALTMQRQVNQQRPVNELIVGMGALQAGELSLAHQQLSYALQTGEVDRDFIARVLIGSIDTHLGRAALFADRADDAQRLLEEGVRLGVPGGASRSIDLMMAEAERCTRLGQDREAIQRWQDIASLLGENTPEHVYRQLSEAYARNRESFGGTPEENKVWGDCHKYDVLEWLHKELEPKLYLEIGVDEGLSLARAKGPAIGIDPGPDLRLKVELPPTTKILPMSSDAFFRDHAVHMLHQKPDLVFIDGMHLFEFALRDFINVEKYSSPSTLVVIDDIYPCHPAQAKRRRKSNSWTGDVWKLQKILEQARPDLTLITLNSYTTGLLLIAGLDPDNKTLEHDYNYWVDRSFKDEEPPVNILARHGAIPSAHPTAVEFLARLRRANKNMLTSKDMTSSLCEVRSKHIEAQEKYWSSAESLAGMCLLKDAFTPVGECLGATEFQVFFPQVQEPTYREECSKKLRLSCNGEWVVLEVAIPFDSALFEHPLRIDPCGRKGSLEVDGGAIHLTYNKDKIYKFDLEAGDHIQFFGLVEKSKKNNLRVFRVINNDPQIYLKFQCTELQEIEWIKRENMFLTIKLRII